MARMSAFRHILYEQKGGYLLLPVAIMLVLASVALGLPWLEETSTEFSRWAHHTRFLVPNDPAMAQLLLGAIAGSCITILSVVYSVLLIALTFASIQFSPRILMSFLRDRVSQSTLGLFIGTFAYCIILLPNVHTNSRSTVPTLSLTVALGLATACLFYLIYFIQHIALAIQANLIVDRIYRETETTLRTVFGEPLLLKQPEVEEELNIAADGVQILSSRTGYVQYIDEARLAELARKHNARVVIHRWVGQFLPHGVLSMSITPSTAATHQFRDQCQNCLRVGPLRSMEMDVEFGVLQMVDIALKAISPAVNDPSTAIACVDHLSAVLISAANLQPPRWNVLDRASAVRVTRRQPTFARLLDIAFDQIILYAKTDMAVSLRLMRALQDISTATSYLPYLKEILKHAQLVAKLCAENFLEEDSSELLDRLAAIQARAIDSGRASQN